MRDLKTIVSYFKSCLQGKFPAARGFFNIDLEKDRVLLKHANICTKSSLSYTVSLKNIFLERGGETFFIIFMPWNQYILLIKLKHITYEKGSIFFTWNHVSVFSKCVLNINWEMLIAKPAIESSNIVITICISPFVRLIKFRYLYYFLFVLAS